MLSEGYLKEYKSFLNELENKMDETFELGLEVLKLLFILECSNLEKIKESAKEIEKSVISVLKRVVKTFFKMKRIYITILKIIESGETIDEEFFKMMLSDLREVIDDVDEIVRYMVEIHQNLKGMVKEYEDTIFLSIKKTKNGQSR